MWDVLWVIFFVLFYLHVVTPFIKGLMESKKQTPQKKDNDRTEEYTDYEEIK